MYSIKYAEDVWEDLSELRAFDRSELLDRIEKQLLHQPTQETRNKKILAGLTPPWKDVLPVWQLRSGEFRVFYDVDEQDKCVTVRAIRRKPPHATTGQIL